MAEAAGHRDQLFEAKLDSGVGFDAADIHPDSETVKNEQHRSALGLNNRAITKKPYLGKMVLRFYLRDIAGLATLISLLLIELLEYNDFFN